jgi:hypothetical protein
MEGEGERKGQQENGAKGRGEEIRTVIYCVVAENSKILQADQTHTTAPVEKHPSKDNPRDDTGLFRAALTCSAKQMATNRVEGN